MELMEAVWRSELSCGSCYARWCFGRARGQARGAPWKSVRLRIAERVVAELWPLTTIIVTFFFHVFFAPITSMSYVTVLSLLEALS